MASTSLEQALELRRIGRFIEAVERCRRLLRSAPDLTEARVCLAESLRATARASEAVDALREGIARQPEVAIMHALLGDALQDLSKRHDAMTAYRAALELDDQLVRAIYGLGCALLALGEFAIAISCFERAVALEPEHARAQQNLGQALFRLGDADAALDRFRLATSVTDDLMPLESIALVIPGSPRANNASILSARRAWAERLPKALRASAPTSTEKLTGDRLRIGYVSAFFASANWMKPVWGLINHHDRERFEVHFFSDCPEDSIDAGYRRHPADHIHDISKRSNDDAARSIVDQRVDVLVDLNGFSRMDRLKMFRNRLAPVVVGWFNFYATTGLGGFDWLIGDANVIPADEERFYSERIVRAPGSYLTFEVNYATPPVAPPPCAENGFLTFGSLASQYKITPEVIAAWSRILTECPTSRLVLKNAALKAEWNRDFLRTRFTEQGIDADRIELDGPANHFEFLRKYDAIDVALDTFPYNGGTTTTEAIWQGVPVLAIDGDRWVARTSASILKAGGLDEFVAEDVDGYVRKAVELATSADATKMLNDLRGSMRDRLRSAPVCDVRRFARNMEEIYRRLWRTDRGPAKR